MRKKIKSKRGGLGKESKVIEDYATLFEETKTSRTTYLTKGRSSIFLSEQNRNQQVLRVRSLKMKQVTIIRATINSTRFPECSKSLTNILTQ